MTDVEQERARIVALIRKVEAEYALEAASLRCSSRRDPRWDDWARAVHKRSMARVLALMIAVAPTDQSAASTETA